MDNTAKQLQNRQALVKANIASQFIEKGVYVDNYINRKAGIVGQLYGDELTEKLKRFTSRSKHVNYKTGFYTDERFNLHRQIINRIVDKGTVSDKPTVVLLLGGSGSGKSHIYNTLVKPELDKTGEQFAYLNCDDIKEELPEFKKYIEQDPKSAASRVHDESADIARTAWQKLVRQKRNFVFDATLRNSYSAMSKVEELKRAGYNVKLVGVVADLNVVQKAAIARGQRTGRYVPLDIIKDAQMGSRDTFKYLATKKSHLFQHISLYNNSGLLKGHAPVKIFENGNIIHQQHFAEV